MDALSKFLKKIPIKWLKVVDFPYFSLYNLLVRRRVSVFLGESRHQLDAKNRLRVPAKFRSELGGKYVVTVGSNECLCVYAYDKFADYVAKLESIPSFDLQAQRSIRKILSLASEVEPDEQGRFILPANLKDFAKIDKNIVINGAGSKVEIWSEEKWDSYRAIENFDQELAEIGTKYGV